MCRLAMCRGLGKVDPSVTSLIFNFRLIPRTVLSRATEPVDVSRCRGLPTNAELRNRSSRPSFHRYLILGTHATKVRRTVRPLGRAERHFGAV